MTKYQIQETWRGREVKVYETEVPGTEARLAIELLLKMVVLPVVQDGEDSAGRQKGRRLMPRESALLACELAESAFAEFRRRNWLVALPDPPPLECFAEQRREMRDAKEKAKEAEEKAKE